MFSSSGLFRDIPCPYFVFGLCERPYCHFKHSKQEESKAKKALSSSSDASSSISDDYSLPTTSLQKTLQEIEENIKCEKQKLGVKHEDSRSSITGKPKAKYNTKTKPTGTPAYNPTPLEELKKQSNPSKLGGRSKYDLALLEGPSSSQEYDPESNFSTSLGSKTLPSYAQSLRTGTKRPADDVAGEDEDTLAKIPKFVSVQYTPTVAETEISDEEPVGQKEDWFSDEASSKSSDNESVTDLQGKSKTCGANLKLNADESTNLTDIYANTLPLEFTPDGFVKPIESKTVKPESVKESRSDSSNKDSKSGTKDTKCTCTKTKSARDGNVQEPIQERSGNIFDLFKLEVDSVFEEGATNVHEKSEDNNSISLKRSGHDSNSIDKSKTSHAKEKAEERSSSESKSGKSSDIIHGKSSNKTYESSSSLISGKLSDAKTGKSSNTNARRLSDLTPVKSSGKQSGISTDTHAKKSSDSSKIKVSKDIFVGNLSDSHKSSKSQGTKSSDTKVSKSSDTSDSKSGKTKTVMCPGGVSKHHISKSSGNNKNSGEHSQIGKSEKEKGIHRSDHTRKNSSQHHHKSGHSVSSKHSESAKHNPSGDRHQTSQLKQVKHSNSNSTRHDKHLIGSRKSDTYHSPAKKHSVSDKTSHSSKLKGKTHTPTQKVKVKKKRQIVNLNVDLFGADSDNEGKNTSNASGKDTIPSDLDDFFSDDEFKHLATLEDDEFSDVDKYVSDDDPFDECLRIFNEENVAGPSKNSSGKMKDKKQTAAAQSASGKKRMALKENDPVEKKRRVDAVVARPSPAQVMMNRYRMIQERALAADNQHKEKLKLKVKEISAKNAVKVADTTASKSLAAASTSFSKYLDSKNKVKQSKKAATSAAAKTTQAVTAAKGQKRKAHLPTIPIEKLKRPVVQMIGTSSKVPSNVRQRYLNMLIDECLKLYSDEKQAFKRGQEEEAAVYSKCSNKNIYLNFAVNAIKRLRNEKKGVGPAPPIPQKMKLSHAAMLDGAPGSRSSYTLHRSGGAVKLQEHDFEGLDLYKRLLPFVMTEDQLKENNFPRTSPELAGKVAFYGVIQKSQVGSTKGYEKLCIRCGKVFEVYPNGKYPVIEECVYHWGKAWKKKVAGAIDTRYTCCSGDFAADGCQVAKAHVHETNKKEVLTGYMRTIPSSPPPDGNYGVYALDCEMVYTNLGMELARVTVVDSDQEVVYESLVKPDMPIIDYNTRFSGITEEDMSDVKTSLRDVQAILLSLFTDKTILMGHSLESDLTALKLIHGTVVDTSLVFPHRMGAPFKRALRNLMVEYLQKIIQDDVGGHDSQEDALACLQLMQYRLKEDARRDSRRLSS